MRGCQYPDEATARVALARINLALGLPRTARLDDIERRGGGIHVPPNELTSFQTFTRVRRLGDGRHVLVRPRGAPTVQGYDTASEIEITDAEIRGSTELP